LRAEREKAAEALLASKYGDPNHAALEKLFNAVEQQLYVQSGGKASDYQYKQDIRHHFDFKEESDPADHTKTKQIATMALQPDGKPYTMLPPDKLINWRTTKAGAKADDTNRRAKNRLQLDDAGHLIALEFGSSPSEPGNLADQNYIQNEWGTWRNQEKDLGEFIRSHKDCRARVEVNYVKDKYGQRSLYWRMAAFDANNIQLNHNVIHLNTQSHSASRTEGTQKDRKTRRTLAERGPILPGKPVVLRII
jgi:hypothetical protein